MKRVALIGMNSLREYIRDKFVLSIFFVALALVFLSLLIGELSFFEELRILAHMGFLSIHLSGLGMVVFLGSYALHREMERQTCLLVLARPVRREEFLLGKWLGVFLLLTLGFLSLGGVLFLLLRLNFSIWNFAQIVSGMGMEMMVLLSFAFFVGTFLRPSIGLFSVIGLFLMGNWIRDLEYFARKSQSPLFLFFSKGITILCPHLFRMNFRSFAFLEGGVPLKDWLWSLSHAGIWTSLFLILAMKSFQKRDIL